MGVLAVDYRTLDHNNPTEFPGALNDVVRAFQWLQSYGPSALHIYGDSSGGTQVVQLLVWMARLGLGRIVALYYRSSASHRIHEHIRCLSFWSDNATEP